MQKVVMLMLAITFACSLLPVPTRAANDYPLAIDYDFPAYTPVHIIKIGKGKLRESKVERDPRKPPPPPPPPNHIDKDAIGDAAITIASSSSPFILVLLSHIKTSWHVNNQAGKNLKALIVGGRDYGEVTGLDESIPVLQSRLMKGSRLVFRLEGDPLDDDLLSSVEIITNNKAASYQSFMEEAEIAFNADTAEVSFPKNGELHVLAAHHGKYDFEENPPNHRRHDWRQKLNDVPPGEIALKVPAGNSPLVLALDGQVPILWKLDNPTKRPISNIILSGGSEQQIKGVDANTRILHRSFRLNPSSQVDKGHAGNAELSFEQIKGRLRQVSGVDIERFAKYVESITGLKAETAQTAYGARSFILDKDIKSSLYQRVLPIEEFKSNPNSRIYAVTPYGGQVLTRLTSGYITRAQINIPELPTSISLFLTSLREIQWEINNPHNVKIDAIVFGGNFKHQFVGTDQTVPIYYRHRLWSIFDEPIKAKAIVKELFGKEPYDLQNEHNMHEVTLKK